LLAAAVSAPFADLARQKVVKAYSVQHDRLSTYTADGFTTALGHR